MAMELIRPSSRSSSSSSSTYLYDDHDSLSMPVLPIPLYDPNMLRAAAAVAEPPSFRSVRAGGGGRQSPFQGELISPAPARDDQDGGHHWTTPYASDAPFATPNTPLMTAHEPFASSRSPPLPSRVVASASISPTRDL